MNTMLAVAILTLAGALAAACSAADGALLGAEVDDPPSDPRTASVLADREGAHRALVFARLVALLACGTAIAFILPSGGGSGALVALILTVVVVFLADTVARTVGEERGRATLVRLAPLVRGARAVLALPVVLGARTDAWLRRVVPPRETESIGEVTPEQFLQVVADEAEVDPTERELLHGVFALSDTAVQEIMVPRVDIVGVECQAPWAEVVARVRSSEHARLPVYDETLDDLLGILYAKDLLPAVLADEAPAAGWLGLVRPASFIPATKPVDEQLREFKASGTHIAIVVDEYGGTAGLVTIEDILEEIVGEIRDEYDDEEPEFEQEDGRRFWVSGRVTLDELAELLGIERPDQEVTTVGGLVYRHVGRVPRAGEQFTLAGYRVVVERVVRRRVKRVYFERIDTLATRGAE